MIQALAKILISRNKSSRVKKRKPLCINTANQRFIRQRRVGLNISAIFETTPFLQRQRKISPA